MAPSIQLLPTVDIIRLEESMQGTIGSLRICKQVFCNTLEPPDLLNKTNKSSIPAQQYECIRFQSPRFGDTFKILDVPDRSDVIFHWGNTARDTQACVLLGQYIGSVEGNRAILSSRPVFERFMEIMKDVKRFILTIAVHY
jgi:hypothetical protein